MTAGRKNNSENKEWNTPLKYVEAVRNFFDGKIYLDPCSNDFSIVNAVTEYKLPYKNGLIESWNFSTIYVNPPYGTDKIRDTNINDWLQKCEETNRLYGSEILALIPIATNTGHWKRYIFGRALAICFLYDTRLRFLINGKDEGKGAPMACSMVYWGSNYNKFVNIFTEFGAVVNIENLKIISN
jgi:hypothetical protein